MKLGASLILYLGCTLLVDAIVVVPDQATIEMSRIRDDRELSVPQKVERLRPYFDKVENWDKVFSVLLWTDKPAARDVVLQQYRKSDTSLAHKLQCGRFLLTWCDAPGFIDEYAPFLIEAALQSGDEFMKGRRSYHSAIGQITFSATGFDGHKEANFEKLKDKRLIPVLIRCLDAKDYPDDQQMGYIGNTERRGIPVALAKLGAIEAAEKLKQIISTSRDIILRFYSAYALGFMLPHNESLKIEQTLKSLNEKDAKHLLFGFGSGLVEKGDALGVQYLSFTYSYYSEERYSKNVFAVICMLQERLKVLKKSRVQDATALTVFYREALTHPSMRALLEFDAGKLEDGYETRPTDSPEKRRAATEALLTNAIKPILDDYQTILSDLKKHHISDLRDVIASIAEKTKSPEIRAVSEQWLREK